jgi:hypothetical protein
MRGIIMKQIKTNKYGIELVWIGKDENYPGTIGITDQKRGYYVVNPSHMSFTFFGTDRRRALDFLG